MEVFGLEHSFARWIERETQSAKVGNQRGWDYLKKLRYSSQSPRPSQRKGDAQQQEKLIPTLPTKVKRLEEEYPEAQVDLWFFDEHRVGLKPMRAKSMESHWRKTKGNCKSSL